MGEPRRSGTVVAQVSLKTALTIALAAWVLAPVASAREVDSEAHAKPESHEESAHHDVKKPDEKKLDEKKTTQTTQPKDCAVLKDASGEVHLISSNRSEFLEVVKNAAIPCGSWISTKDGWVDVSYPGGTLARLGQGTFAQVFEVASKEKREPLLLYRGTALVKAQPDAHAFQALTANSRATFSNGVAILQYDGELEESALLVLEGRAQFENRYLPAKKIDVKPGELSGLNFKLLRTVPTEAKAVKHAGLHQILEKLELSQSDVKRYGQSVQERARKVVALPEGHVPLERRQPGDRMVASEPSIKVRKADPGRKGDSVQDLMIRKLVGDEEGGENLVRTRRPASRGPKYRLEVKHASKGVEDANGEKKRILDELSRLSDED